MSNIFRPTDPEMMQELKDMQEATGSKVDGILGPQTNYNWWKKLCPDKVVYPHVKRFYDGEVIYCKNIGIDYSQNKKSTSNIDFSIGGVFQWQNNAVSVLIYKGKVYNNSSSHAWLNKPETILYKTNHGVIGAIRALSVPADLISDIEWAISGVGIHNYDPLSEGFGTSKSPSGAIIGQYSDVLRYTGHNGVGITQDDEIVLIHKICYGEDLYRVNFKDFCMRDLGLKYAVMLDGGHIASINSPKYKKNVKQKQNNIIHAI